MGAVRPMILDVLILVYLC